MTDIATGQILPLFTKDRSSEDICHQLTIFLVAQPWWKDPATSCDVDSEKCYRSEEFTGCTSTFGYRIERTPARDKHANGTVQTIETKFKHCNARANTISEKAKDLLVGR